MAKKAITKKTSDEISEAKIRIAIWELKSGKTKKKACETLGIAYNTKRLDTIISEFQQKEIRIEELKKKARFSELSDSAKKDICKAYVDGESSASIAERLYLTPDRIKKVLIQYNIPIRGRGKKTAAKTEHIVQNLEKKFIVGEKVFYPKMNCTASIKQIFDEDYLDIIKGVKKERLVEFHHAEKVLARGEELVEFRDYELYYVLDDGSEWKRSALQNYIKNIETMIEETGREYYRIWIEDYGFYTVKRENLFPIGI